MNQAEKDKLSKYGKVVWDFANAKTTDDILISFFSNVQSVFNFSSDFTKKALSQYPTMKMTIDSLSETELTLLRMLLTRNNILKSCNEILWVFNQHWDIKKYDAIHKTLVINEAEFISPATESHTPEGDIIYSSIRNNIISVPFQDIESYIDNLSFIEIAKEEAKEARIKLVPGNDIKTVLKERIQKLVKQCQIIEKFKQRATNRFKEIETIAKDYKNTTNLHAHLKRIQTTIKSVLLQIIASEKAYKSDPFQTILDSYNYNFNRKRYIIANNKIVERDTVNEQFFLGSLDHLYIFNVTIAYCLIEYLKNQEYQSRERLTVCKKCNNIFSKSNLNIKQIYCPVCSRKNKMTKEERAAYMAWWRKEQKKKKEKGKQKNLEREISNLIKQGYKPKEARELAALKIKGE